MPVPMDDICDDREEIKPLRGCDLVVWQEEGGRCLLGALVVVTVVVLGIVFVLENPIFSLVTVTVVFDVLSGRSWGKPSAPGREQSQLYSFRVGIGLA